MPLAFHVTNAGRVSVTLPVQGRVPIADFIVTTLRGRLVWSRLRGQIMLGSLRLYPLPAGGRLSFRQVWNQRADTGNPVPAGEYLVRGVLLTDAPAGLASPPAKLRLER